MTVLTRTGKIHQDDNEWLDFEHVRCELSVYENQPFAALERGLPQRQWACYYLDGDPEEAPLYIGHTCAPLQRMRAHRSKPWWPEVRKITLLIVANQITARYMEESLHAATAPRYGQLTQADQAKLRLLAGEQRHWIDTYLTQDAR